MKNYHFIGIGGIGMSALARILVQRGAQVSGSDQAASSVTEELIRLGARVHIGHAAEHVPPASHVVYSTAVNHTNPEYQASLDQKLPLIHRSEMLAELMVGSLPLLVAGTHGKTTTTSLLTHVAVSAGLKPSFAVGGVVANLESNGGHGEGNYFVAEADESDGSFLRYPAFGAIITNVDNDHLDHWKTESALIEGFHLFGSKIGSSDHLVWCGDDPILSKLKLGGISYGTNPTADLRINGIRQEGWKLKFDIFFEKKRVIDIELPLIGFHNALNGAAVFGLALRLGIPEAAIREAFLSFRGVGRRAERKGEVGGATVYDDYGHHPTEIATTLAAFKAASKGRLIVAFQPHRYTRTRDCMEQFKSCFNAADCLVLTEIYSAGEAPIPGITTAALAERLDKQEIHQVERGKLAPFIRTLLRPGDTLVTMGAGDITKLGKELCG
jgi:UDP-N-acetylmuramate--alanine ligase